MLAMPDLAIRTAQRIAALDRDMQSHPALETLAEVAMLEATHRSMEDLCNQIERLETRIPLENLPCPRILFA